MIVKATLAATCVFLALFYTVTGTDTPPVENTDTNATGSHTKQKKKKKKNPPGPNGLPYFGVHFQVDPDTIHLNIEEWRKQYGSVFMFKLLGKNVVVLNTPEVMRKAFDSEEFSPLMSDRPFNFVGEHIMYGYKDVLLNRYSESFKNMKKLMISCINKHGFSSKHFQDLANEEFRNVVNQFHATKGRPVDPVHVLLPSFCKLIGSFFSGKSLDDNDPLLKTILTIDRDGDTMIQPKVHGIFKRFSWLRHCCGYYGNLYRRVVQERDSLFQMLISNKKDTFDKQSVLCCSQEMLISKEKGNDWLTDEHINGMYLDLINTSVLTTKSIMSGMIFMWLHHPEVQQNMRDEINGVIGPDRLPTVEDRKSTPYVQACIYELLRYQSHLPLTAPHANLDHEVVFEDLTIPKGSIIFGNLFGAHHDEALWEDPWKFKPERFLTENGELVPRCHPSHKNTIAFGVGERRCVGQEMAYNRMFLYTVHLLRAFEFLPEEGVTLSPHDPLQFESESPVIIPPAYSCRVVPL